MTKPDVKNYQYLPLFLQHYYAFKKQIDPQFSYSTWARELEIKNRNYLRLVVMGERPMNQRMIKLFLSYFKFDSERAEYFTVLVNYTQSKNDLQRKIFGEKILSYQNKKENFLEIKNHFEFLSNSIYPRILTLLTFEDLAENSQKISQILGISEKSLIEAFKTLESFDLVKSILKADGSMKWEPTKKFWKVPNNFHNLAYREFYNETFKRAKKAIDIFEPHERRFRSLFLAMNSEEFSDFLKDFEAFVQEQFLKRDAKNFEQRQLYQLNFNFFPDINLIQGTEIKMNAVE